MNPISTQASRYPGGYFTISFSSADTYNFACILDASVGVPAGRQVMAP